MKNALYIAIVALVCLPINAFGAPSISSTSGTFSDGNSITITGTGFETKSTATPTFFDDFDSNDTGRQDGDTIYSKNASHYGTWTSYNEDAVPEYDNANQRTGSILSSYVAMICADTNNNHAYIEAPFAGSHQSVILASWWARVDSSEADPDTFYTSQTGNIKDWRVVDGTGTSGDNHCSLAGGWGNQRTPIGENSFVNKVIDSSPVTWEGESTANLSYGTVFDTWRHFIVFAKAGSSGVADGSEWIIIGGTEIIDSTGQTNWQTGEPAWQDLKLGYYCANYSSTTLWLQYDDVYLDTTWQSVWIGNASTWASCTHREVQIPTAWSTTNITTTVNQGSFSDGTAYLFVVDSNGDVSSGYEIILGGANKTLEGASFPSGGISCCTQ